MQNNVTPYVNWGKKAITWLTVSGEHTIMLNDLEGAVSGSGSKRG